MRWIDLSPGTHEETIRVTPAQKYKFQPLGYSPTHWPRAIRDDVTTFIKDLTMITHTNFVRIVAALAILVVASSDASATILLSPAPSTQTIAAGGLTTIDLRIAGLGAGVAPSLGAYDVDLMFDPSVLSFVSATFGDGVLGNQLDLFGLGNVSFLTPSTGMVNLFELSLDTPADLNALQADAFVLASLSFSGL